MDTFCTFICNCLHNDAPIDIVIYIHTDIDGLITDSYNIDLAPCICWMDVLMGLAMRLYHWCMQVGNGRQDTWSPMQYIFADIRSVCFLFIL